MRRLAIVLFAALTAIILHSNMMVLSGMQADMGGSHAVGEIPCPIGSVCPFADEMIREALAVPLPVVVSIVFTLIAFALFVIIFESSGRYRSPAYISLSTSPFGLRSIFKKE